MKTLAILRTVAPLLAFLMGALLLAFQQCPDEKGFWPIALASFSLAIFLAPNKEAAVRSALVGMSQRLVPTMIMAWLLAAVLGQYMRSSGVVDTLAEIITDMSITGGLFVASSFLIASLTALSTGTAVGTILLITPILFPAGAAAEANPTILLGAILAGGAFGDDFSPLSDTTIASAEGQGVPISLAVRNRFKYVLPPAILSLILYAVFGGQSTQREVLPQIDQANESTSLFMLLAPTLVLVLSMRGKSIISALLAGIVTAVTVGLIDGSVPMGQLFGFDRENFSATSILIDGMNRAVGISIFTILLIGMVSVTLESSIVKSWFDKGHGKSVSSCKAEFSIVGFIILTNSLLAHNTVTILAANPAVTRIRKRGGISALRASQLVDLAGNTVMHQLPYMITVILVSAMATKDLSLYGLEKINSIAIGLANFQSWGLFGMLILVICSGMWRHDPYQARADE